MGYRPRFEITPALLARVRAVGALRERIQGAAVQVAWIPALQKDTRACNAHSSTAIEGNPPTLKQVRAVEAGKALVVPARARREVVSYFAALRHIEKQAGKKRIEPKDVLRLHRIVAGEVMEQGDAGRWRPMGVKVGGHVAPPPGAVPGLVRELIDWWNKEAPALSPVLSSAIVHYRFEAIHPFADGNGRTGRALALWELYRRGFDAHHIFSVDEYFWEDRPRYYAALAAVQARDEDLTAWLEYCAEGLEQTLDRVWQRIQRFSAAGSGVRLVLQPKQEQPLQLLRAKGSLTPREIWDGLAVSKQGAMDLIRPLVKAKLVKRVGTLKNGCYVLR